jgi:HEAT repeat protein
VLAFLGVAGSAEDLPFLRGFAGNPDLAGAAAEAIDRIGSPPRALPALRDESKAPSVRLLEDLRTADGGVRRVAISALAVRKEEAALPALRRLLDDPAPADASGLRVWHYAMSALELLAARPTEGPDTAAQRARWRRALAK